MRIGDEYFDCRMFFDAEVELGTLREVGVQFLVPSRALAKLVLDMPIALWDGKEVAVGKVKEILT